MKLKNWFISHKIIIFTGFFIGIAATILQTGIHQYGVSGVACLNGKIAGLRVSSGSCSEYIRLR